MRLEAGTALGPYEIVGSIGAGGMGEVYRARDRRLGREVALKILPREVSSDPERLARFEREARSASSLNHPNIVTIHDFDSSGSDVYMVMELVRGESLREAMRRGAIPAQRAITIAAGVASGLAAAHEAGIIHRDLKPENVMVTEDGVAKILDFGLVKPALNDADPDSPTQLVLTGANMVVGTLSYMSPEQAEGGPLLIQSDQFSLGVMLYEMIVGRHPFRRANAYETVSAVISEPPAPLPDAVPAPVRWIVDRCLAKSPRDRYASTRDLAHDLRVANERTDPMSRSGLPPRSDHRPRRHWMLVAGVLAAALAAALVAAALYWRPGTTTAPPLLTLQGQLAMAGGVPDLNDVAVLIAISPDARYLVSQVTSPESASDLWLHDLRTGEARIFAENAFAPAWSSDGDAVAFFADGALKTMRIAGGPATVVCQARPEGTPSWHGGNILFVQYSAANTKPGLYRVDAGGGTPELLMDPGSEGGTFWLPWWPHFLPDGRRFLYMNVISAVGRVDHEIRVGSLDGEESVVIARYDSRPVYAEGHLLFVRDGTLMAQAFDPDSLQLTGEAHPVASGLHYFRSTGLAAFTVSNNGVLAWIPARSESRLAWYGPDGTRASIITSAAFGAPGSLSPDGTRYAAGVIDLASGTSDVWVYDLARGSADRRTFDLLDQRAPVWGADGETLYYRSDGFRGPPDIAVMRPGEESGLFFRGPSVEHPEHVSADGKWLLFTSFEAGNADIKAIPIAAPAEPTPLMTTPFRENNPRFSPDGTWVAFSSDLSGRSQIYVRGFDSAQSPVQISTDGGILPRWSIDGSTIMYLAEGGRVTAVPFRDGRAGVPRILFQEPEAFGFEPAPDGRFLVHLRNPDSGADLGVLVNWRARIGAR